MTATTHAERANYRSSQTLTLYEHETIAFDWDDQELALLERLNLAVGATVLRASVHGRQRVLIAAQHVGVVHLGMQSIQILPKLYRSASRAKIAKEATSNLLHLLAYAADIPVRAHGVTPLLDRTDDWFEILTQLFTQHLFELWQRGPARTYRPVEQELPVLKGQWRINQQLCRPADQHRFHVRFDEFTADTALNRILRFVVERLRLLTHSSRTRQQLDTLRVWMANVALLPAVSVHDAAQIRLSRLNQHYAPLLNLALLFLGGSAVQMAAGRVETFAFTFDMNQLFEAFVIGFIRRHHRHILTEPLRTATLHPQSKALKMIYLATADDGAKLFRLKPDLVFRDGNETPLLLDTKYKRLNPTDRRLGIAQSDLYQMTAYALRYNCPRIILLYPQTADISKPLHRYFVVDGTTTKIEVRTLDITQDLATQSAHDAMIRQLGHILNQTQPQKDAPDGNQ